MDDSTLLARFEAATLTAQEWTHRTHVKVAYLYVRQQPTLDDAIACMRRGIQRLNAAIGVEESPTTGYNETVTQAFMRIVHATDSAWDGYFPTACPDDFCEVHPHLLHRTVLRLYYSPEGRDPPREKTAFIPPDLAPLPRV